MAVTFNQETFREDFSFRNSPAAVRRFPFPFAEDSYSYSVNIEPHIRGAAGSAYEFAFDVDEHYVAECEDRRITLSQDPERYIALPHMMDAQWDFLELMMESLARDYPELFMLHKDGGRWTWTNQPLGIRDTFTFGAAQTLPREPFDYIARQAQGDFVLLDQRDGDLWADAGMVTSQADWSLAFDAGMSFKQWHGPVPMAHEIGVFDRALKYLLALRQGQPVRRLNWTMTVHPRLDTAPENYPVWGPDRTLVTADNAGQLLHLRVELQALFRLPRSNGILFSIRCYLASLDDIATYPRWAKRLHRVLQSLPQPLVEYKGLARYRDSVLRWLSRFDDGQPLERGTHPE
jgi:dimethylamine monooxygenase subunit A